MKKKSVKQAFDNIMGKLKTGELKKTSTESTEVKSTDTKENLTGKTITEQPKENQQDTAQMREQQQQSSKPTSDVVDIANTSETPKENLSSKSQQTSDDIKSIS